MAISNNIYLCISSPLASLWLCGSQTDLLCNLYSLGSDKYSMYCVVSNGGNVYDCSVSINVDEAAHTKTCVCLGWLGSGRYCLNNILHDPIGVFDTSMLSEVTWNETFDIINGDASCILLACDIYSWSGSNCDVCVWYLRHEHLNRKSDVPTCYQMTTVW